MASIIFVGAKERSGFALARALDYHGHAVTLAATAGALIEAHRAAPAELVIVHCRGSDDLIRIVGFRVEDADTPVLALLDKQAEGLLLHAVGAGADAALVEGSRLSDVLGLVDRMTLRAATARLAA